MGFLPWWGYVLALLVLVVIMRSTGVDAQSGKVIGIIGKMGSGKSFFAVRMAYQRMLRGAEIYTNFSMNLGPTHETPCGDKCQAKGRRPGRCRCVKHCPCQLAGRWHRFEGWEQFATITNAVVIIDEADLYAPAYDAKAIPDYIKWKLKMCRKHKVDLYWIAQSETQVSRILRLTLTNEIRVCQSWFGGKLFTAKTYPPAHVGRAKKHTGRSGFLMRSNVAGLYDTLETIRGNEDGGDGTMAQANALADAHESGRAGRAAAILSRRKAAGQCLSLRDDKTRYCTNKVPEGAEHCRRHTAELAAEGEGDDQLLAAELAAVAAEVPHSEDAGEAPTLRLVGGAS